jgi:Immunoglobulin domain
VVGASRGETLDIKCEVEADPPVVHFRWKFNNSGETLEVSSDRFYSEGPSSSVLRYTTASELDYGSLSCWAVNAVGHQVQPCVFQVSNLDNLNGALDFIFRVKVADFVKFPLH